MRVASAIGLVFAFFMGLLAVVYVSALQDQGEALATVGAFFQQFTAISILLIVGIVGVGTLIAAVYMFVRNRF